MTPTNLPHHVAIIPDGNRRWAKAKGLPAFMGHRAGAKAAEKIFQALRDQGVKYVSFWGCSVGNVTKRDPKEITFLFRLFNEYFKKLLKSKDVFRDQVRIRALGLWEKYFPPALQKTVREMVSKTSHHNRFHLTFLLAYSGLEEMLAAVRGLVAEGERRAGHLVTPQTLKNHLYTGGLPPVDLVIRAGGEPHLSEGFMMWDTAEAQLYFTDTFWPAFTPAELGRALETYATTERRHGG